MTTMRIRLAENFRALFYAPFYATHVLGFYAGEGIVADLFNSPAPASAAASLLDGSIDISWGGPMRVMKARDLDPASPLVCFCEVAARDPFFLVGKCQRSGFDLADLPRLKVATVSEVPTPWLCLQHDLRERGVDPGRINRVTDRTMGDNLRALRKGEVDVVQMFEPYVSMAVRAGAGDILYAASNRGPTVYTTFLTTRDSIPATVWRSPPWSAQCGARLIGSRSTARRNWRMRSRHSTRTCYQISLRLRFDATETRACGRERRRYHVKGLIAWPKASSLVGLFPECIVTRTVSIKACARRRRRGDRMNLSQCGN